MNTLIAAQQWLKGKKTYISAILLTLVSLLSVLTGELSIIEFLQSEDIKIVLGASALAGLRAALDKAMAVIKLLNSKNTSA